MLADTKVFQEKLIREMNDLVEKHFDDESVPEVSPSDLFNRLNSCSSIKLKNLQYFLYNVNFYPVFPFRN